MYYYNYLTEHHCVYIVVSSSQMPSDVVVHAYYGLFLLLILLFTLSVLTSHSLTLIVVICTYCELCHAVVVAYLGLGGK